MRLELRLSLFYYTFFSLLGVVMPFWAPYLSHEGFNAEEIGLLLGAFHLSRLYAPSIWGYVADRHMERMRVVKLGALLAVLAFIPVLFIEGFWPLLLAMLCFSFFWNAILPQFEVVTLSHLGEKRDRYGKIRLWGSVGFIAATLIGGELFIDDQIEWVPIGLLVVLIAIYFATWIVPKPAAAPINSAKGVSFANLMRRPEVIQFFALIFFAQLAHGPYNGFYTLLLQQEGYSGLSIGLLWSLGVLAEIAMFAVLHKLWQRFSLVSVFIASLMLAVLRWLMMATLSDSLLIIILSQLLHAASFAVLHASGIRIVQQLFPAGSEGRAQALHSSLGFGLGGLFGSIIAGYLWHHFGSGVSFIFAAAASLIALLLISFGKLPTKVQQNS
jgi:PPP family 3-phenylpropionic acid transporter